VNKSVWIVPVVIILAVVAFLLYSNMQKSATPTPAPVQTQVVEVPSPTSAPKTLTVNLSAQNNSSESGTAVLTEQNGKVMVTLNLTGAPKGVTQPAHIHKGACPTPGVVLYPLTSPVDGKSDTTLDTTFNDLKNELPLAVNIHKSGTQSTVYVSCGNITL